MAHIRDESIIISPKIIFNEIIISYNDSDQIHELEHKYLDTLE